MTTSLSPEPSASTRHRRPPDPSRSARLVRVEWAKATDTRAARWLLALVALSTAGMMLVPVLAPTTFDQTYASYLRVAALAADDPPARGGDPDAHRRMEPTQRHDHVHPGTATHPSRQRQAGGVDGAGWWRCGLRRRGHRRRPRAGGGLGPRPGGEPDRRRHHRLSALRAPQRPRRRRARGAAAELGDGHRRLLRPPRRRRASSARHRRWCRTGSTCPRPGTGCSRTTGPATCRRSRSRSSSGWRSRSPPVSSGRYVADTG